MSDSTNDKGNNNNSSVCDPNTDILCYSEEQGLCVPGLGCSGGEVYREWWVNDYLPMMDDFLLQDIATTTQFLADPLNLGLDAYENYRGIPIPKKYGFGVDFFIQLLKDSPRTDLSTYQRLGRAGVNGVEGIFTSGASSAAGVVVGDATLTATLLPAVETGNLWAPPVAYWAGYASTYLAVNYAIGYGFEYLNSQLVYPFLSLGTP